MKRGWILIMLGAACLPAAFVPAQRADRDRDRERRADRELPRAVERAILRRYDDAKITVSDTRQLNGVTVYDLKAATGRGDIEASVTEAGDILVLGYPGVTEQTLPRPVLALLRDLFPRIRPEEVEKFERTKYLLDLDMGGRRDVRVTIDAVGRLRNIQSAAEVRSQDIRQYERATRNEEDELTPRLRAYFQDPRVQAVYRHPDVPGYFWIELTNANNEQLKVLMNAQRDIAMYDVRIDVRNLPPAVQQTLRDTLNNARVREAYRHQLIYYQITQQQRDGDEMTLSITPLGTVVGVQSDDADAEERRISRRPDRRRPIRAPGVQRGVRG
jgi:hypothetical protein